MNQSSQISAVANKSKLRQMLDKIRVDRELKESIELNGEAKAEPNQSVSTPASVSQDQVDPSQILDRHGKPITLNSAQLEFVNLAGRDGKSAVLIGAAGTGKTTCQKAVTQALIQSGHVGLLEAGAHKHLVSNTPGIVICAYTRRAVANIRKNLPLDLQSNAITIHKLLEYSPVYNSVMNEETGEEITKMSFQATRHEGNPLPSSIRCLIFEESSMIGTDLYQEVINACPHNPQLIFLGDIQQLPPVFGPAILGFKLLELPVVELTEVYRQALESPIISLAHRILSGTPLESKDFIQWKRPGQLTIHPWKKKIDPLAALQTAGMFFTQAADNAVYDPEEDIILIPFNKSFGTDELNKIIANHLAHKRGVDVFQVIAGFNTFHCAVGDKVLYDKEDAVIVSIERNSTYTGKQPVKHSPTLDYWGFDSGGQSGPEVLDDDGIDFLLTQVAAGDGEDRVRQASHILTLKMLDSDQEIKVDKASDINSMLLGYALTFHKSQGSEWSKVFIVMHQSHATMINREMLYTAVTRAKQECYIICEPTHFVDGILRQRIQGNTLEEKAKYFMGKLDSGRDYSYLTPTLKR
jgi:exodeoxyribonuclease V alpha subunit